MWSKGPLVVAAKTQVLPPPTCSPAAATTRVLATTVRCDALRIRAVCAWGFVHQGTGLGGPMGGSVAVRLGTRDESGEEMQERQTQAGTRRLSEHLGGRQGQASHGLLWILGQILLPRAGIHATAPHGTGAPQGAPAQ